jgi:hypothetical protein
MRVEINVKLSEKQKAFCSSPARFKLWRAGRRSGKTNGQIYDWGKWAIKHPNSINWYVAQDTATVKELTIPLFEHLFPHELIADYSKSDKCHILFNGAKCFYKSANSADSLRGRKIHNLGCEEAAFWQNGADIYHNILRPQLADTLGRCSIVSSPPNKEAPTGAEWFRRLEQSFNEEIKKGNADYASFYSNIWENPYINDGEKKDLQANTPPDTWQIEYMGEYCDKVGQVYWEFDPLARKYALDPKEPILTRVRGIDWGISDNTACVWISLLNNNRVYIEAEYVANNLDVPSHAHVIKARTTQPPKWTVLDSACWARDAGMSSVAKRFGAEGIGCVRGTKDLDGSISDMKLMFSNGSIIINPSCLNTLQAIDSWQHGQHEPDVLAAIRYAINSLIKNGRLLAPTRKDKPFNIIDYVKQCEKDAHESERALLAIQRGRTMPSKPSFRFYDGLR